jgi:hypothetical protein
MCSTWMLELHAKNKTFHASPPPPPPTLDLDPAAGRLRRSHKQVAHHGGLVPPGAHGGTGRAAPLCSKRVGHIRRGRLEAMRALFPFRSFLGGFAVSPKLLL